MVRVIVARAPWLLGALCLTLPLWSLWVPPDVPLALKGLVGVLLITAGVRPVAGLCLLAVLAPVAVPVVIASGTAPFGGTETLEAMVLAVMAGVALRWSVLGPLPGGRLTLPSWLFAIVVATSAVTLLGVQQLITEPLPAFLATCWTHVTRWYFEGPRAFPAWHEAAIWIEGILLAVVIERVVRHAPRSGPILALVAACGLAAESVFSLLRLWQVAARSPDVASALWHHALSTRISPHFPDINAMGSLFALGTVCWLTIMLSANLSRWARAGAVVGAAAVGAALWLTGSRAAVGATLVVTFLAWRSLRRPSWRAQSAVLAGAAAIGLMVFAATQDHTLRAPAAMAIKIRVELARVGVLMTATHPWVGVGLGEFSHQSIEHITPGLAAIFPAAAFGENAHNQLVQVLAELGAVGLVVFLWYWSRILGPAFRRLRVAPTDRWLGAWTAGLCAFHLSALMGHPFLTPYVVLCVFLIAGLVAGLTPAGLTNRSRAPRSGALGRGRWPQWLVAAACVALVISVPARITAALGGRGNVVLGASRVVGELDGIRYRVSSASSRWFVRAPARLIIVPLRASTDSTGPCAVRIMMDGVPADELVVDGQSWRHVRFAMYTMKRGGSHTLDVHASGQGCVLLVGEIQRP